MCVMMCKQLFRAVRMYDRQCKMQNVKCKMKRRGYRGIFNFTFLILHSERGYALLLAVVITSAVLSAASALAGIVLSEIRQTREIANVITAQVSAESDIEEGLFILRKGGYEVLCPSPSSGGAASPFTCLPQSQCNTPTAAEAGNTACEAPPLRPFAIAENDFVAFPLSPSNIPGTFRITEWTPQSPSVENDACGTDGARSWIEVTSIAWNDQDPANPLFETSRHPYSYASDYSESRVTDIPIPAHTVEVRIRALYCSIAGLSADLPARVILRATGQEGNVRQTSEVAVPRVASVSGLFDFVIFSECELNKGINDERC